MFQIISDGGCDFSKEEIKTYGVEVVPFYICLDGETYLKEGVDIDKLSYFQRLQTEKNLFPKTSQPNPQDYIEVFEPYLKDGKDLFILTISSKLSGSFNSASMAVDTMKKAYPDRKIALVDSLNATLAQGLILKEVIKIRDAGYLLAEAVRLAGEIIKSTRIYFTLDSLDYLKKGGRVGPTTALVGGLLNLRPILQVEEGYVTQLDNVRGRKKAIKLMEEALLDVLKDETERVSMCIGHIMCDDEAATFKANAEESLGVTITNPISEIGAAIGTHTGPGAIGFAYCRKYETVIN